VGLIDDNSGSGKVKAGSAELRIMYGLTASNEMETA